MSWQWRKGCVPAGFLLVGMEALGDRCPRMWLAESSLRSEKPRFLWAAEHVLSLSADFRMLSHLTSGACLKLECACDRPAKLHLEQKRNCLLLTILLTKLGCKRPMLNHYPNLRLIINNGIFFAKLWSTWVA